MGHQGQPCRTENIIPPAEIQNAMEKQMKAERDRRETLFAGGGHKAAAITRAEGDKQAMILAAEGERDARIARAEGEAKAIYLAKKAEADLPRCVKQARTPPYSNSKNMKRLLQCQTAELRR